MGKSIALFLITVTMLTADARAQRVMECVTRGVVAVNQADGKVFVSWRLLGDDPDAIAFNVHRKTGDAQPLAR